MENVASMASSDREHITQMCEPIQGHKLPYHFDAAILGPQSRPRLFWTDINLRISGSGGLQVATPMSGEAKGIGGQLLVRNSSVERIDAKIFLDKGVTKVNKAKPFPTAVRWIPRAVPPADPTGIEDCDPATMRKWEESGYAMAPYQFKKELGVVTEKGEERLPNADE